jgi:hypothetical protein
MEVAMAQIISSNRKTAQQSLRAAAEDLAGEIATLDTLDPAALLQKWKALFGTDPSPLLARIFMVRAIAYRLQEQRYGGLKPSTQRLLDRVCEGRADVGPKRIPDKSISAGNVLIREWGGVSHRVTVLDHGVVYHGRRYRSPLHAPSLRTSPENASNLRLGGGGKWIRTGGTGFKTGRRQPSGDVGSIATSLDRQGAGHSENRGPADIFNGRRCDDAYRPEIHGSINRQSTPDDIHKRPVEWWRRPTRPRTWRTRDGWPGSRSRPFRQRPARHHP